MSNIEILIKRLEKEGKLRKQEVGFSQVEALLKQSLLDLEEANKIVNIAGMAHH